MSGPVVYFVQCKSTGYVKIGKSANLEKRMAALRAGFPDSLEILRTIPGYTQKERWLHEHFADRRLTGEWFRFDERMLSVVPLAEEGQSLPLVQPPDMREEIEEIVNIVRECVKSHRLYHILRAQELASLDLGVTPRRIRQYWQREVKSVTAGESNLIHRRYSAFRDARIKSLELTLADLHRQRAALQAPMVAPGDCHEH